MRRPPIACQRAVHSLQSSAPQHIWVPDEVLSRAVNRFFRSTCPQQKRHGSNVPGPLEARRRAAKRRMTASAGLYPQDSFPVSFSLGTLFGYRSKPQTSWRYEPPSLPKNTAVLDRSSPIRVHNTSTELRLPDLAIDASPVEHDVQRAPKSQSTTPAGTYDNTVGLEIVSQDISKMTSINTDTVEACLDRFKSSLAAAEDSHFNLVLVEAFMRDLPPARLTWKYYAGVLQHLHQLRRKPGPVLHRLLQEDGQLLRMTDPLQVVGDCTEFLDQLDLLSEAPLVRRVLAVVAQLATEAGCSTTESHDLILLRLMQRTESQASFKGPKELASTANLRDTLASKLSVEDKNKPFLSLHFASARSINDAILSVIRKVARGIVRFADAERALFYMPRQQSLKLVPAITSRLASMKTSEGNPTRSSDTRSFDTWLRLLHHVDMKANADKALLKVAIVSLANDLGPFNKEFTIIPQHFLKALFLFHSIDVQVQFTANKSHQVQVVLADVLLQMQAQSNHYTALLDLALPLIAKHAGLIVLLRCVRTMEETKLPLSTRTDFDSIIANKVAALSSSKTVTSERQIQARAYDLQACEKLANALSRMGHTLPARIHEIATLSGSRQFNNILVHARANNSLPIAYRDVTTDMTLMERVAMAHQLASHYSQDTTRSHREVWRSIYYLYKFLQSNSLPIGPLFTKAVVHASITRPLTENYFVSARRLIWVCHLVARVEGDEVAAQVENRFYTWRGDLIGRAKRVFVGVGGNQHSKAHVGTMKRLGLI